MTPSTDVPGGGKRLIGGRYVLEHVVGESGMAQVYAANDPLLNRKVAVKKVRFDLSDPLALERAREACLREARILARLTHPHIVPLYDAISDGGEVYLVFEFIDGKPLDRMIQEQGRLSLETCKGLFRQICEPVSYSHKVQVLHRDLKPSNIMVDARGWVRIIDFGLAGLAGGHPEVSGTPAYMAPEQHAGRIVKASDIYALGVCLYEALSGELPFRGPDFLDQKRRMEYAPLGSIVPDLPQEVEVLIATAMAPDPRNRIQDAAEFSSALVIARGEREVAAGSGFVMVGEDGSMTFDANSRFAAALAAAGSKPLIGGKWELAGEIGFGGMGTVYAGHGAMPRRTVAIKKMHPALRENPKMRERFLEEAQTIALLSHPYIVTLHEIIEEEQGRLTIETCKVTAQVPFEGSAGDEAPLSQARCQARASNYWRRRVNSVQDRVGRQGPG